MRRHQRGPGWAALSLATLSGMTSLSGCFPSTLPLGGISPMQGSPLPAKSFQLGLGLGKFPDLMGAVPDIGTNPVRDDPGKTNTKFFLTVGAGLGEWVDVGLSSSRGLYSNLKLVRAGRWSLSVSPAYYRVTEDGFEDGDTTWIRASNRNLTGLLAFQTGEVDGFAMEVYAGSGMNWYEVEIRSRWTEHSGRSPTLLGGVTLDGVTLDLWGPPGDEDEIEEDGGVVHTARISLEITGAWITQRTGRRDFLTVGRVQLALRSWPAW